MDRLGFGLKAEDGGQRTKGFFFGHFHRGGNAGQNRRLEKTVAQGMALAAAQQPGAVGEGVLHMVFDLGHRPFVDQRALGAACLETAAHLQLGDTLGQACNKGVMNTGLYQETVDADAGLSGIAKFGNQRAFDRTLQVGVVEHDEGGIAAQLQRNFFQGRRALCHQ